MTKKPLEVFRGYWKYGTGVNVLPKTHKSEKVEQISKSWGTLIKWWKIEEKTVAAEKEKKIQSYSAIKRSYRRN